MRAVILLLASLLAVGSVYGQCVEPIPNGRVEQDAEICSGTYELEDGFGIENKSGISVICQEGTVIRCATKIGKTGIFVRDSNDVTIDGCRIENCENGISLQNSYDIDITNNFLQRDNVGIASKDAFDIRIVGNTINASSANSMRFLRTEIDLDQVRRDNLFGGLASTDGIAPDKDAIMGIVANITEPTPEPEEPEPSEPEPEPPQDLIIEVVAPNRTTAEDILSQEIRVKNVGLSEEEINERVEEIYSRWFEKTQESLDIKRTIKREGNITKVTIEIVPKTPLEDVSLYELIPKCFVNFIEQVAFDEEYEVIKSDPLVVWHFANLEETTVLGYEAAPEVDAECAELFVSFGIAIQPKASKVLMGAVIVVLVILTTLFIRMKK